MLAFLVAASLRSWLDMEERILQLLARRDYVPLNSADLMRRLRVSPVRQQELEAALQSLEREGRIARIKRNRYVLSREADLVPGTIRMNRQGRGFLTPDDSGLKEIMVPESATSTALHGDRVLVRREVQRGGREPEEITGTVVRVLERRRAQIVGTLQKTKQFLYVVPDDPRMPHDIYVPPARDVGRVPQIGEKVVVELRAWESRHVSPEGEIIEVLGPPDAEGVDMLSVLRQYGLALHFPREVLDQARAIGSDVREEEIAGRVDCRNDSVITIDPDDAKDFDDAICLQRISKDQWRLWVHIADVSHYVKPGTPLDEEAQKRGNSTYLVDRVIPMLPEALSNELCSLKPNVDRLTKCVEFVVSNDGRVLSSKFYSAVIHSKRRYTYAEVLVILQRKPLGELERMLHDANALAQKIRGRRFKTGSLDLDFPERKIRLDERGRILRIEKVENDISHQLIEEYMLLANEAVAARLMARNRAGIYRVHEEPSEKRLSEFREEVLGHDVPCGDLSKRGEVQKLLKRLGQIAIGPALKIGLLKSLMRARYAAEPLGHYGLAKQKYTHFTSPIRRYADLVVHRALFDQAVSSRNAMTRIGEHISGTERNSADAERDSKDVKLFAFLNAQLASGKPERYDALVTDVRNFGFFVDVPDLAMSGLVHLSSIEDDFYVFDNLRNHLIGRRTRKIIRLGDRVVVQIAKVDTFKKQVDFRLAETPRAARREQRAFHPTGRGSKPFKKDPEQQPRRRRGASQKSFRPR
jgi:ribonuclease R